MKSANDPTSQRVNERGDDLSIQQALDVLIDSFTRSLVDSISTLARWLIDSLARSPRWLVGSLIRWLYLSRVAQSYLMTPFSWGSRRYSSGSL